MIAACSHKVRPNEWLRAVGSAAPVARVIKSAGGAQSRGYAVLGPRPAWFEEERGPVSRILSGAERVRPEATIHLGRPLPSASNDRPEGMAKRAASQAGQALPFLPIWSFSGWGLPSRLCHHRRGALLL